MKKLTIPGRFLALLLTLALFLPFCGGLHQPIRASASGTLLHGVDISTYQGDIDWTMLAGNDIQFVIMRGGKVLSETTDYFVDDRFEHNYEWARKVGLEIGVYLYNGATSWEKFEETINLFLETIKGKTFDFPVFLDVESDAQTKLGKEVMTQYVLDGLAMIEAAGFKAGVYANLNWFRNYLDGEAISAEGYPLWLARYTYDYQSTDYSDTYSMWQYSDKGQLAGNGGDAIDLDIAYVDFNYHPELHSEKDPAYAPMLPLKAYPLENIYQAPFYADLTTQIAGASVFPTDECEIREVYTNGWCKFAYPTNAGDRIGFLPISAFLPEKPENFTQMTAAEKIYTYRRAALETRVGFIAEGDQCWIVRAEADAIMAIYPVFSGWKAGWYPKRIWKEEDARFLREYIHGKADMTETQLAEYDVNKDGTVDVIDLVWVRRRIMGFYTGAPL